MKRFSLDNLLLLAIALIILIPKFDFLPVQGTTTSIRIEDFVVAFVYAVWLIWLLHHRSEFHLTWVHKLMLLVVGMGIISTGWGMIEGTVIYKGLGILNVLRRVEYFGMFWVAYSWLKRERLNYYIQFLLGLSVIVVVVDVLQWLKVLPMYSTWEGYSGQTLYYEKSFAFVISTFAGHYELGGYLLLMIPLVLGLLWLAKSWKQRAALALLLAGYYFAMYFSFSRAAYFAMLFELALLFVLWQKYWLILLPVADMTRVILLYFQGKYSRYQYSIGVVHTTPTPTPAHQATHAAMASHSAKPASLPTAQNRLKLSPDTELTLDPGGAARVDVWQNALHHFYQNPIIGTGYSSIGTGADNQYLRTLAETGLLGLAALLALIGYVIWRLFDASRRMINLVDRLFLLSLVAGIGGVMGQAILIDILDSSKVALFLWFLVGLGLVIAEQSPQQE